MPSNATLLDLIAEGTLWIPVASALSGVDPATNNPIITAVEWELKVAFTSISQHPQWSDPGGQPYNYHNFLVKGYVVEIISPAGEAPKLPANRITDTVRAKVNDKHGKLELKPVVQNACLIAFDLEDLLGEKIVGIFEEGGKI
jgi:hypothetical protein